MDNCLIHLFQSAIDCFLRRFIDRFFNGGTLSLHFINAARAQGAICLTHEHFTRDRAEDLHGGFAFKQLEFAHAVLLPHACRGI